MDTAGYTTRAGKAISARIALLERRLKASEKNVRELTEQLHKAKDENRVLAHCKDMLWKDKWELYESVEELRFYCVKIIENSERQTFYISLEISNEAILDVSKPMVLFQMIGMKIARNLEAKWREKRL